MSIPGIPDNNTKTSHGNNQTHSKNNVNLSINSGSGGYKNDSFTGKNHNNGKISVLSDNDEDKPLTDYEFVKSSSGFGSYFDDKGNNNNNVNCNEDVKDTLLALNKVKDYSFSKADISKNNDVTIEDFENRTLNERSKSSWMVNQLRDVESPNDNGELGEGDVLLNSPLSKKFASKIADEGKKVDKKKGKKKGKKKDQKGGGDKEEEEEEKEVFVTGGPPGNFSITPDYIFDILERKDLAKLENLGGLPWLYRDLDTDPINGIDPSTIDRRVKRYGRNELDRNDPPIFWEFLVEAFKDPLIIMLCICALISIVFGMTLPNPYSGHVDRKTGWIEGTAIIISVMIVTLTGSISNYKKAKRFEEMEKEQSVMQLQVFRGGHEVTVMNTEVVVGDILVIEGGSVLSCDGLFVHGNDLKCNESAMTGEPDIISKNAGKDPFFLSGTQIEEGSGRMLVVAVGMESIQGRLKSATSEDVAETPLQEHLGKLADDIAKLALIVSILLVASLCIKEGILISQGKEATAGAFLRYVIVAITVVVVAIPEGLPLAVTISLAYSMKSMMDDNCLVRVLASCETMGAATAVCSDKTGTLTTNVMTVVEGVVCGEEFVISGYGVKKGAKSKHTTIDRKKVNFKYVSEKTMDAFCESLSFNSTAREQEIDGKVQWVGNKTEHGLLGFCNLVKRNYAAIRAGVKESEIRQFPFNSTKKRMTTIVSRKGRYEVFIKGASEVILDYCNTCMQPKGNVVEINEEIHEKILKQINEMAGHGNRTIGVAMAYVQFPAMPEDEPVDVSYTLLGVLGIQDPIREEVPNAVLQCHSASIVVRMVTGDNLTTAVAIAKKCHIYQENNWDWALTGEKFREMYNEKHDELLQMMPRLRVLARSSPQDKYILVRVLQELGEVVGVTGDGTNDAPALKLANVGFAMVIGTDIARGAADMVLLDNNFASVVKAVKWGRAVNDNIRKFIQYQLSINFAGVLLTFVGALASQTSKEPFSSVQLLWLNLIMDTLAALCLATEKPSDECLYRLPTFKQSKLISRRMKAFVALHGLFQVAMVLVLLFTGHTWLRTVEGGERCDVDWGQIVNGTSSQRYEECKNECKDVGGVLSGSYCQQGRVHSTIIFNAFIWFQIFNMFNARKLHGEWNIFDGFFTRSRPMVVIVLIIALFQVFAVEVAGIFLDTTKLTWYYWLICIGFGAMELIVGAIVRMIPIEEPLPEIIKEKMEQENNLRLAYGINRNSFMALESHRILTKTDPSLRRLTILNKNKM